jgi:hypothetical protein
MHEDSLSKELLDQIVALAKVYQEKREYETLGHALADVVSDIVYSAQAVCWKLSDLDRVTYEQQINHQFQGKL